MGEQSALILNSIDLNIFTELLSKTVVQLWSQACPTENKDPYDRRLKPRDFVADGGREGIVRCVVSEDTMDALLGTINCDAELYLEVGCCGRSVLIIS